MDIHKALSSPVRKQIIKALSTGPKYLSELSCIIERAPQTTDFHLKFLLAAGLVRSEWRSGKKYYILKKGKKTRPSEPRGLHPELLMKLSAIEAKIDRLLKRRSFEHLY